MRSGRWHCSPCRRTASSYSASSAARLRPSHNRTPARPRRSACRGAAVRREDQADIHLRHGAHPEVRRPSVAVGSGEHAGRLDCRAFAERVGAVQSSMERIGGRAAPAVRVDSLERQSVQDPSTRPERSRRYKGSFRQASEKRRDPDAAEIHVSRRDAQPIESPNGLTAGACQQQFAPFGCHDLHDAEPWRWREVWRSRSPALRSESDSSGQTRLSHDEADKDARRRRVRRQDASRAEVLRQLVPIARLRMMSMSSECVRRADAQRPHRPCRSCPALRLDSRAWLQWRPTRRRTPARRRSLSSRVPFPG